jgi:TonB family protein
MSKMVTDLVLWVKVAGARAREEFKMARLWARFPLALLALPFSVCQAQTAIPDSMPGLIYPPIARAAHVQGDVVVSFRQTLEGKTADVRLVSGPPMLQGIAIENVKDWHFTTTMEPAEQVHKVTFHFQLNPPRGC